MKLYGSPFSPRAHRVAVALAELGVPVDIVNLNPGKGENKTPDYLAKNPMGKIPTLEEDDGWTLWESCAVLVYLGEKHADKGLFPTELRAKAEAMRWLFWTASHLDPSISKLYAQKFLAPRRGGQPDQAIVAAELKELERYLPVLEERLRTSPWVLGPHFSLVDVAIGAGINALLMKELELDRTPYPHIASWHERLLARPSWKAGKS